LVSFCIPTGNSTPGSLLRKHTGSVVKKEYLMFEGFNVAASGLTHSSRQTNQSVRLQDVFKKWSAVTTTRANKLLVSLYQIVALFLDDQFVAFGCCSRRSLSYKVFRGIMMFTNLQPGGLWRWCHTLEIRRRAWWCLQTCNLEDSGGDVTHWRFVGHLATLFEHSAKSTRSASPEILRILWPPVPFLSHIISVDFVPFVLHLFYLPFYPCVFHVVFFFRIFHQKPVCTSVPCVLLAQRLIFFDLVALIIFEEKYESRSSSMCSCLQFSIPCALLHHPIFFTFFVSKTSSSVLLLSHIYI
jgi:hypothetical protein